MDLEEVEKIRKQFQNNLWPRFIQKITINGLRGWVGNEIEFQYPVVAIVGENGTGKSTLLKSLACAYVGEKTKTFNPSDFFIETQWDKIEGVRIDFSIKQGNKTLNCVLSKKNQRWNLPDNRPKNNVYIQEISSTLPLDATAGYAKMDKTAAQEIFKSEISEEYRKKLSEILNKEYQTARFVTTEKDQKKEVGVLIRTFGEVSQYHQGAGEDATLDLIRLLQDLPNNSLLLIDKIEASLHPKSQRRLVKFLLWFCRIKKCQIILSTHSPYVLQELPPEARIMLLNGGQSLNVVAGISPEFAMQRIDDELYPELEVVVEDTDAAIWLAEIIRFVDKKNDKNSQN